MAGYTYDAWGNFTVTDYNDGANSAARYNPFTYRGYYFDSDLGLYYLNSRYYDSNTGRFINADGQLNGDILGYNLFAYCYNNPIMYIDPEGTFAITTAFIIGLIVGAIVGAVVGGTLSYIEGSNAGYTGWELAGYTAIGAVFGGIVGAGIGGALGYAFPAVSAFMTSSFSFSILYFLGDAIALTTVTVTGAEIAFCGCAIIGITLMAKMPLTGGPPNGTITKGGSTGTYDSNGHLTSRRDTTGAPHYIKEIKDYALPHTHVYKWDKINDIWRIVKKFILPY